MTTLHDPAGQPPSAITAALIAAGRRMDRRGWVPATAGNLSMRCASAIAITRSGCHKGCLQDSDIILVNAQGQPFGPQRPSAETLLHCQIYARFPHTGAVLHGHSVAATVLSMAAPAEGLWLQDYEVQKALAGQSTHAAAVNLPVFNNDQDMVRMAAVIEPALQDEPVGYVIRGHGVYAWGQTMDIAMTRLEAIEFLLACVLEKRKLTR